MREGWRQTTLRDLFEPSNSRLGPHDSEPAVFSISKYDGVMPSDEFFGKRVASAKLHSYKVLPSDSWVYSTIHIDEGSIARNTTGTDGVVSPMYTVMRWISEIDLPGYAEILLRSAAMLAVYSDNAQGSINRRRSLPWKVFSGIPITLPTIEEQRRIVDMIAAVDNAVVAAEEEATAQDQAVDRLRELTPAAPLKPLIELLESIDSGLSMATPTSETTGARLLRVSAVQHGRFNATEHKRAGTSVLPDRARVRTGDVLMTRSNTPERVGFVAQVDESGDGSYIPDLIWRLNPKPHVSAAYLVQVLSSPRGRAEITARASGTSASMQKVSKARVSTIAIPDASPEAQAAYVAPIIMGQAAADAARVSADAFRALRSNLLTVLLSGEHEIPSSYDDLLEGETA